MKEYKYKFSIIIPIYNVEKYLADTVDSVINQTIGFKNNIQIILVDDGSPDNSESICRDYVKRYPNNIKYIKQENAGVSAARNTGIPYAEGKYINFLDSDDKWGLTAFEKVYRFFEEHYDEVDVVSCRMKHFEATSNFHAADYKYKPGNRVADLFAEEEQDSIQLHVTSSFIKAEALGETRFVHGMKFGEDSLFINEIILKRAKLGILQNAFHYYRKRKDQSSAVQTQRRNKEYYNESPRRYYYSLIKMSEEKYGRVIPYIQNILTYDICWRLGYEIEDGVLSEQEYDEYFEMLHDLLSYVDEKYILTSKVHRSLIRKLVAMSVKTKSDSFLEDMVYVHGEQCLEYHGINIVTLSGYNGVCCIHIADIENNCLRVEGTISKWLLQATKHSKKFALIAGDKIIEPELKEFPFYKENTFYGTKVSSYCFSASVPLDEAFAENGKELMVRAVLFFDDMCCDVGVNYGKFVANYNSFLFSYNIRAPYCFKCYRSGIRVFRPRCMAISKAVNEAKCLAWLLLRKHRRAFMTRVLYIILNVFLRGGKKIWLISDRSDKAGDNAEAFFKYVCKNADNDIKPIFVISKDSEDRERLSRFGKVVCFEDKLYPYYFLSADKVISSSGGEYVINPFGDVNRRYLADLVKFDYVFLQHGITMNDLSAWLQKFNKKISLFVTATKKEYNSITDTKYLYSEDEVKLTGFARYDELEDKAEKLIVVIPTWRRSIKESYDSETRSIYFDGFKETEYFKFYNSLINNGTLLDVMRENGYKGLFCLHPIHKEQYIDFESNDVFTVNPGFVNYKEIFSKGAVLVTDYSSVAFDFSYLRKPIVYTQFDKDEFFEGQIFDQGYFSYVDDGMGPVCCDMESTVNEIVSLIESGCELKPEYRQRTDNFFAYGDKNNSRRIYEGILEIDKRKAN